MAPPSFEASSRWQYKCPFRKAWADASPEEDNKLKEAYLKMLDGGSSEVAYLMNAVRFKSNFKTMMRTNVASKRQMEMRLRDGMLPDAGGKRVPLEGSKDGTPDERDIPEGVPLAQATPGPDGQPIPHEVRRAWGYTDKEITAENKFSFMMEWADKDYLGELLAQHLKVADIRPDFLLKEFLTFTDKRGTSVTADREGIQRMLNNAASFPVHVKYDTSKVYQGLFLDQLEEVQYSRTMLKVIYDAAVAVDFDIRKVKHKHQKRTFERFQLYMEEHIYQDDGNPGTCPTIAEMYAGRPWAMGMFGLIDKTGPNMGRILKGENDVLEYLFGG